MQKKKRYYIIFSVLTFLVSSCKKLVEVPGPVNTITTDQVFNSQSDANAAVVGIYSGMSSRGGGGAYSNGALSAYAGASADELNIFSPGITDNQFLTNTLLSTNSTVSGKFWTPAYADIYRTNIVIEGCAASASLSAATKNQYTGEAKFLRAFIYFCLVNLFGDVPLITTTAWASTDTLHRTPVSLVYKQIEADLNDAQSLLATDYSVSGFERTRVNQSGAAALLARTYLYEQKWKSAEEQSTKVIDHTALYHLLPQADLDKVFLANSEEAILQLSVPNTPPYATEEAGRFVTPDAFSNPNFYLTDQLLAAFEPGDARKIAWVDSTDFGGFYYYPYKYKVLEGSPGNITEYYMILRLAEQYLIRAEARVMQHNLSGAITDLNIIRERAGLPDLPGSLTETEVLTAIMQERRIELFAECGHRWLDLKRTGQVDTVLAPFKPQWQGTQKLYPIPFSELQRNPNFSQNPGF